MLAILGQINHTGINRVLRAADGEWLAFQNNLAGRSRVRAINESRQFGSACAYKACNPQHLADMQVEGAVMHALLVRHLPNREHNRATAAARVMLFLVEG